MVNQRWDHSIIEVLLLALLALLGSGCSQLNVPYQGGEGIAVLQAKFGAHAAPDEDGGHAGHPVIIGHRGSGLPSAGEGGLNWSSPGPIGNTPRAIEEGIRAKVDWIEIDLRRSKHGELVLFHDEEVDAKTKGSGAVSKLTVSQLQEFDVLVDPPEKILTLEEFGEKFLHLLKGWDVGLILDVKDAGLVEDVLSWLKMVGSKGLAPENVILFGEYEILKDYCSSGYRLGYTFTWSGKGNWRRYSFRHSEIIERLKSIDAEILVVPVVFTNKRLIERASKEGVETWSYGSDDQRDWDEVVGLGVGGLIVDYPKHAVGYFNSKKKPGDPLAEQGAGGKRD